MYHFFVWVKESYKLSKMSSDLKGGQVSSEEASRWMVFIRSPLKQDTEQCHCEPAGI